MTEIEQDVSLVEPERVAELIGLLVREHALDAEITRAQESLDVIARRAARRAAAQAAAARKPTDG